MSKNKFHQNIIGIIMLIMLGFLGGCGNGRTNNNLTSSISFNKSSVTVATDSYTEVILTLNNPQYAAESAIYVTLSSANQSKAIVTGDEPYALNKCTLTASNPTCTVTIAGISQGATTISANSATYNAEPLSVTVANNAVVNGNLAIHTPNNQPLYVTNGSSNQLSVSLDSSTGITNLPVTIRSSNSAVAIASPNTCTLSSGKNRTCIVNVNGISNGSVTVTASATGYTPTTPAATNVGSSVLVGTIAFSKLGYSGLPESLAQVNIQPNPSLNNAESFIESISLINSSGIKSVIVTPTQQTAGSNMVTFPYNPTVTLSSSTPTVTVYPSLWQGYTSGDTYIIESSTSYTPTTGSIVNTSIPQITTHFHIVPTIVPITRTITFVNNCNESVWIGVTSSSAKAVDANGGAHTFCEKNTSAVESVISNPTYSCPTGSSCLYAESASGMHSYSCYWNAPVNPSNNYQLQSGESVVTYIESAWYDKNADVQWSGNFYGRTKCDPATGICQTGTCPLADSSGNGACVVNVGGTQPVTLAEITMQPDTVDSYDVSAIPGVNLPMSFGPDPKSQPAIDSYACGTAGSMSAQGTLNASTWAFPSANFAASNATNFTIVESGGSLCPANTCSNSQVCGLTFNSISNGTFTTTCGKVIAYVTPNGIATIESGIGSTPPPYYSSSSYTWSSQPSSASNNWSLFQLNLCQTNAANCNSGTSGTINTGYGPYTCTESNGTVHNNFYTESANTCGCTNWSGIATPTKNCSSDNPAWDNNVQPYISFVKKACPTCYSYPYDDASSSFSCKVSGTAAQQNANTTGYVVTYCPNNKNL